MQMLIKVGFMLAYSCRLVTPCSQCQPTPSSQTHVYLSAFELFSRFAQRHKYPVLASSRHSGLTVSALDSGSCGLGSSPGRGHCVVFLGKTLLLLS